MAFGQIDFDPSSAGKTSLMDAVLRMMPAEEVVKYSALSGQSPSEA